MLAPDIAEAAVQAYLKVAINGAAELIVAELVAQRSVKH